MNALKQEIQDLEEELRNLQNSHAQCGNLRQRNDELSVEVVNLMAQLHRTRAEGEKWRQRTLQNLKAQGEGSGAWRQVTINTIDELLVGCDERPAGGAVLPWRVLMKDVLQYLGNVIATALVETDVQSSLVDRIRTLEVNSNNSNSEGGGGMGSVGLTPRGVASGTNAALVEQAKMHFEARMNLLKDIDMLRREAVVAGPEFHNTEVRTLLGQIASDEEVILRLCAGQQTFTDRIMEGQRMRRLYEQQRDRVIALEQALTSSKPNISNSVVLNPNDPSSTIMADVRKFVNNALQECEREKQEWRSRCLNAEEQCRILQAHVERLS